MPDETPTSTGGDILQPSPPPSGAQTGAQEGATADGATGEAMPQWAKDLADKVLSLHDGLQAINRRSRSKQTGGDGHSDPNPESTATQTPGKKPTSANTGGSPDDRLQRLERELAGYREKEAERAKAEEAASLDRTTTSLIRGEDGKPRFANADLMEQLIRAKAVKRSDGSWGYDDGNAIVDIVDAVKELAGRPVFRLGADPAASLGVPQTPGRGGQQQAGDVPDWTKMDDAQMRAYTDQLRSQGW